MEDVCRAKHGYATLKLSGASLGVDGWVCVSESVRVRCGLILKYLCYCINLTEFKIKTSNISKLKKQNKTKQHRLICDKTLSN